MSETDTGYVYTLSDPRTDEVRYVGATKNPKERFRSHISHSHNKSVNEWVANLEDNGLKPEMRVIDAADTSDLSDKENKALRRLSDRFELLNEHNNSGYNHGNIEDIDNQIAAVLADGRNVPSNIAEELNVSRQYVQQRLQVLEAGDHVINIGRGVYELVDDPRSGQ